MYTCTNQTFGPKRTPKSQKMQIHCTFFLPNWILRQKKKTRCHRANQNKKPFAHISSTHFFFLEFFRDKTWTPKKNFDLIISTGLSSKTFFGMSWQEILTAKDKLFYSVNVFTAKIILDFYLILSSTSPRTPLVESFPSCWCWHAVQKKFGDNQNTKDSTRGVRGDHIILKISIWRRCTVEVSFEHDCQCENEFSCFFNANMLYR